MAVRDLDAVAANVRVPTKFGFLRSVRLWAPGLLLCAGAAMYEDAQARETTIAYSKSGLRSLGIVPARGNTRRLTFEHRAERDVAGTPDLLHMETMTVVGGVIFVQRARPSAPAHACPHSSIDLAAESGRRLRATFRGAQGAQRTVAATLYDWELAPLAAFVESDTDALFTYMGVHGQYHEAFVGTLAGINLFLLDTFRSLKSPARAHLVVATAVPGYTDQIAVTEANERAAGRLVRWMRGSHLMFTDAGVDFTFQPLGDSLAIAGDPYWIAVRKQRGRGEVDRRFDDSNALLAANAAVFGSGGRLAKHAALFRYLKAECPAEWQALRERIYSARPQLDLYTIPRRLMPYAIDQA